jgi:hypothetical protein
LASYYKALAAARENLGLGDDLDALLMIVALKPHLKTEDELANLFAVAANVALSTQQLRGLVAVIANAAPAQQAPAPEPEPTPEPVA